MPALVYGPPRPGEDPTFYLVKADQNFALMSACTLVKLQATEYDLQLAVLVLNAVNRYEGS